MLVTVVAAIAAAAIFVAAVHRRRSAYKNVNISMIYRNNELR